MCGNCGFVPVVHTMKEWIEMPDEVSKKGVWYVVSDYRTDNDIDVARFKFGDGKTLISKLPWVTAAITENDVERWDESCGNDLGEIVIINEQRASYIFPSDGYLMIEFHGTDIEYAEAQIYGASGRSFFTFSKCTNRDNQSKEVYVRKGMKCEFITASKNAVIKFVPLI